MGCLLIRRQDHAIGIARRGADDELQVAARRLARYRPEVYRAEIHA